MRAKTVEYLRTPIAGGRLELHSIETAGDEVISGRLIEADTGVWYRVEDGIVDLLPFGFRDLDRYSAFCRTHGLENGPAPTRSAEPDENATTQLEFFSEHRDIYEEEVVSSPFYNVFDRVTIGQWLPRHIGKNMIVAEIGCGTGRQTLPLTRTGADIVSIDVSESMLQLARKKVLAGASPSRVDFVIGTAENLPLARNVFDAAIIFGSLHHFSDPSVALQKVSGIVRSGGRFYMLEPHESALRSVFDWTMRHWMLWKEEANDAPLFTASQFQSWLKAGGFAAKISYGTYLPPHLFYVIRGRTGERLLSATDALFNAIPGVRRLGGVIIVDAVKRP